MASFDKARLAPAPARAARAKGAPDPYRKVRDASLALTAHLSISDETDYALAFVVIERG